MQALGSSGRKKELARERETRVSLLRASSFSRPFNTSKRLRVLRFNFSKKKCFFRNLKRFQTLPWFEVESIVEGGCIVKSQCFYKHFTGVTHIASYQRISRKIIIETSPERLMFVPK